MDGKKFNNLVTLIKLYNHRDLFNSNNTKSIKVIDDKTYVYNIINNKKEGTAFIFNDDNTLYGKENYKNDLLNGTNVFYRDNTKKIEMEEEYHNGILQSIKNFRIDGTLFSYLNNKDKTITLYDKDGLTIKSKNHLIR